jgi:hypothetical protein
MASEWTRMIWEKTCKSMGCETRDSQLRATETMVMLLNVMFNDHGGRYCIIERLRKLKLKGRRR